MKKKGDFRHLEKYVEKKTTPLTGGEKILVPHTGAKNLPPFDVSSVKKPAPVRCKFCRSLIS